MAGQTPLFPTGYWLYGRRNPLIPLHGTSGYLSVSGKTADPSRSGLTADLASYIPDAIPVHGTVLTLPKSP